ncbi:MAG: hypothetical protein AB9903_31620 [Vulcanimicrobiota bacterium]
MEIKITYLHNVVFQNSLSRLILILGLSLFSILMEQSFLRTPYSRPRENPKLMARILAMHCIVGKKSDIFG